MRHLCCSSNPYQDCIPPPDRPMQCCEHHDGRIGRIAGGLPTILGPFKSCFPYFRALAPCFSFYRLDLLSRATKKPFLLLRQAIKWQSSWRREVTRCIQSPRPTLRIADAGLVLEESRLLSTPYLHVSRASVVIVRASPRV